jgi:hypothetical protein
MPQRSKIGQGQRSDSNLDIFMKFLGSKFIASLFLLQARYGSLESHTPNCPFSEALSHICCKVRKQKMNTGTLVRHTFLTCCCSGLKR